MVKVIIRKPEDNSLERLAPVELATFRLVKLEKQERSLFCDLREDFMGHVLAVDFDCLEYKNNPEPGWEWLPSRCYLNINGEDYHYCDILRNFGDILTIISNGRTEELLKEITE